MIDRDEKIINKLEVTGTLIQRGIKHFATHPKMSLRYFSESLTQVRALMKFISPEGRT
jgi:hypothetical protein